MADDNLFSSQPFNCPIEFRNVFRRIHREWAAYLDPAELSILYVVLDRTLGWGKEWETITLANLTSGVHSETGETWSVGARVGTTKALAALHRLQTLGMLLSQALPHSKIKYSLNLKWTPDMLRTPRKALETRSLPLATPRSLSPRDNLLVAPRQAASRFAGCKKNNIEEEQKLISAETASAEGVVEQIETRYRKRSEIEFTSALANKSPSLVECLLVWRETFNDTFAGAHPLVWKEKEKHAFRAYARRWEKAKHSETFGAFVQWSVLHWRAIASTSFRGMKSVPELPAISFFIALSDRFEIAFSHRAELDARLGMTTRESMVARITSAGVPSEVAKEEVEQRLGLAERETALVREKATLLRQREDFRRQRGVVPVARARTRTVPLEITPRPIEELAQQWDSVPESFGQYPNEGEDA